MAVIGNNGFVRLTYYPPQDPQQRRLSYLNDIHWVLGHAGKAKPANNGVVYVWDYPITAGRPDHMWSIAHEILHYVAKGGHSTDSYPPSRRSNNHMPNSDNESRLMTGLDGPKRDQGPTTLIKFEWDRLNQKFGPEGLSD